MTVPYGGLLQIIRSQRVLGCNISAKVLFAMPQSFLKTEKGSEVVRFLMNTEILNTTRIPQTE